MRLQENGMDLFYIDESNDGTNYVVTAVTVPFLRPSPLGGFDIVWSDYLNGQKAWRKALYEKHTIPELHELHGSKLAKRRGNFKFGNRQFSHEEAVSAYRAALSGLDFLGGPSIMSVSGHRGRALYGEQRLLRVMHALFQRMRMQCRQRGVNAMTFFDEGHPEYRSLYRKAKLYLPTGSASGDTVNRPLEMFVKDGNFKNSKYCGFTQIADLVSYCVLQKTRSERGQLDLSMKEIADAYDCIPSEVLNKRVSRNPADGIVRLS